MNRHKKKNISVSDFSSNLSDIFRVQSEQVDKLVQVIMDTMKMAFLFKHSSSIS